MRKTLSFSCIVVVEGMLLAYLLYSEKGRTFPDSLITQDWVLLLLMTLVVSAIILTGYLSIMKQLPWKNGIPLRLTTNIIWIWSCSILLQNLLLLYFQFSELPFSDGLFTSSLFLKGAVVGFILSLLITWGDFSWFVYNRYTLETLGQLQAGRKQKEIQFGVLRSQLTPHFLFNSLNTASNLTTTRPEQAGEFIRKLAYNFTNLLIHASSPINSLEKELELVDNFFHLMQIRFGNKIILEKRIKSACLCKKLPALSLQLMVENALKHNVASLETPVTTIITADHDQVVVVNNTTIHPQTVTSHGIGLKNLQEHYRHFSNKQMRVDHSESHFQVILPYIDDLKTRNHV